MSRTYLPALLALLTLAAPTSTPLAQTSSQGGFERGEIESCAARAGGSRMRSNNCENDSRSTTLRTEHELTINVELPKADGPQCEASALTEYSQRDTLAHIMGTISVASCPAGTTGAFTLAARVKDGAGEIKSIEFKEAWQRDDAQDHTFNSDYPIGENVELVSVRVRNLTCTCAAAEPAVLETAPPAAESPLQEL